jgi:hypothetical protein
MASDPIPPWLTRWAQGELEVREQPLDSLVIVSGKIAACDPLVSLEGAQAFETTVKPGKYKVALGRTPDDIVFAVLRFGRAKVAKWSVARCPGEDEDGVPAFAVDSGNACFVDAAAAAMHVAAERARDSKVSAKLVADGVDPSDANAWHEAFATARDAVGSNVVDDLLPVLVEKQWGSTVLDEETGANLVAFKSGAGDGMYPVFWGLDSKAKPVALIIDFGLLDARDRDDDDEDDEDDDIADDEPAEDDFSDFDLEDEDFLPPLRVEKERPPAASPLLPRAHAVLTAWEKNGRLEIDPESDRDALAEALLEKLVSLEGHRHLGAHLSEWLMERGEIADVFATDDELENDLRSKR